jgi:transposase
MSPRDQLNSREIQVATMVWEGKTNPEIATVLGSTEQVIKNQLREFLTSWESGAGSNWLSMWLPTGEQAGPSPRKRRRPVWLAGLPRRDLRLDAQK